MSHTPRLLPILVGAAALLFCAKLGEVWLAVSPGPVAAARAEETPHKAEPPKGEGKADAPKGEASKADPSKGGLSKTEGTAVVLDQALPAAAPRPSPRDPGLFTPQEVQVLQSLAQRRDELDKRSAEIDQREALLQAAEQRIDDKIAKLAAMQQAIDGAFKTQDKQDDSKIKSLVKIYETMKPKEAARIFEQLDQPVLLEVLQQMKEAKMAPIFASMDPAKAKAATLALAQRHSGPELKN
jgi:flagellar motility protein MotE (MotC chaperone)